MSKKLKAVTFSYDDGVTQDIRLIEIFNKYNLKCTFNINSELLGRKENVVLEGKTVNWSKVDKSDVKRIYQGHEVAAHTLTHPSLKRLSDDEIVRQVEQDRLNISEIVGYDVVGMAYPGGTSFMDDRVQNLIENRTGIKYARTTTSTFSFDLQEDLLAFNPTVYQHVDWDAMFELGQDFIELNADKPQIFYIWGHAHEFDIHNTWDRFEKFCEMISNKSDIFYGTNAQCFGEFLK